MAAAPRVVVRVARADMAGARPGVTACSRRMPRAGRAPRGSACQVRIWAGSSRRRLAARARSETAMPAEAARKDLKSDLVARLADCGHELADPVARVIRDLGSGAIPALVEILEDDELAQSDAPGGGHVPIHAVTLLADLHAT